MLNIYDIIPRIVDCHVAWLTPAPRNDDGDVDKIVFLLYNTKDEN